VQRWDDSRAGRGRDITLCKSGCSQVMIGGAPESLLAIRIGASLGANDLDGYRDSGAYVPGL
jgi:hypothetical protein